MEFYPHDASNAADANACAAISLRIDLIVHHSCCKPAISNANLGQLTLDLVINTLLQIGDKFGAKLTRVGHLLSQVAPPIAGSAAFTGQHGLCLNLEVYQCKEKNLTIIQQRALVLPGRARAFVQEILDWAITSKVATLGVIAGCDDMLRHDRNMISRPIRTICSSDQLVGECLTRFEGLAISASGALEVIETSSLSTDQWTLIRGAGLAPLLHAQCDEKKVPFIAWVMPCAEGNNVPDAIAMTTQLFRSLRIDLQPTKTVASMPLSTSPTLSFAFPHSWNQLFGRSPDVSLYL
ncbi:hypothetical protein CCR75_006688 [Bremia lactucae]|uniref:Proteasome assembly chaperone 2 n=1 Tax=Bremia lactucae TaxID=4779 RepID=A0A976NXE4_BRELC|nr:hypothetical protein CCR75_006688 [Bremia lactucae]